MSQMVPEPPEVVFTRWLENLRVDLAQTVGGVLLRGARPVPVGDTSGATKRPLNAPGALVGYGLTNRDTVSNVNVKIYFRDGKDEDADVILSVTLAPGESVRDWFGPGGIHLSHGLFIDYVKDDDSPGELEGSVWLRGVD